MKIINRYILKNFFSNFFLYFSVVSILLVLNYIYQLIYSLLAHRAPLVESLKLFIYLLPSIFVLTIPIAFLLSVLITLSVLNENRELLVIDTLGISRYLYLSKLAFLAVIFTIILTYFNTDVVPKSYKNFRYTYSTLVTSKLKINFFDGSTVHLQNKKISVQKVHRIENKILLKNVMIYSPVEEHNVIQTIYAKYAYVYNDINDNLIFDLHDGNCVILSKSFPVSLNFLKFDNYVYIIYNEDVIKLISKSYTIRELTNTELLTEFNKETSEQRKRYLISEFVLRYCLSFSIISFTLIGIVLGIKIKHGAKPLSFLFTVLIVIVYYLLFTGATAIIENYSLPINFSIAHLIIQTPNIFLIILSLTIHLILK